MGDFPLVTPRNLDPLHACSSGVPEAACALDIAGAIAWISQIGTFVQHLGGAR